MPKHVPTWIVLTDSHRVQVLQRREGRPGFDIVTAFEAPLSHAASHDIASERPGRDQESANPAHHAIEPRLDPHDEQSIAFLRTVADYLNRQAAGEEVGGLILFAPPRALGQLRKMLHPSVSAKIRAEAPKDLTQVPIAELPQHLDALL